MKITTLKSMLFISIPLIIILLIIEGIVRLLNMPVLLNESYFFGFYGCPKYFQKSISVDNKLLYKTNPQKSIAPTTFSVNKPEKTFRVFTLGGSATFGEPFGTNGSFSNWLYNRLSKFYTDENFEVINCGRKGFGSTRVKNIFEEVINYDPDLIVVYFGNNEVRDYHFHRMEIIIESRPFLRNIKRLLDNIFIFRMIFHSFFKRHTTSFGAETINKIITNDSFNRDVFSNQIKYINNRRRLLDRKYGGKWDTRIDSTILMNKDRLAEIKSKLIYSDLLPEKIKNIFKINVRQIIEKCKHKKVPIIFLTRSRNLYYNKDARILFNKFDDTNKVIKSVCQKENISYIETLQVLLDEFRGEIGYNAFMDIVHPTLMTNQIIAKSIVRKMLELDLIHNLDRMHLAAFEKDIEAVEKIKRENFAFNSQYYSLIGWQKLICLNSSDDLETTVDEIVSIAKKALDLDQYNEKAYLLLGALYSLTGDAKNAKMVWEKMKLLYGNIL